MSKNITSKDVATIIGTILFLIFGIFYLLRKLFNLFLYQYNYFKEKSNEEKTNSFSVTKLDEKSLADEIRISNKLRITYCDSKGVETQREIKVNNVHYFNDICYLDAYCYLRDAPKTFRTDRILDMVNLETGEFISPKYFLEGTIEQVIE